MYRTKNHQAAQGSLQSPGQQWPNSDTRVVFSHVCLNVSILSFAFLLFMWDLSVFQDCCMYLISWSTQDQRINLKRYPTKIEWCLTVVLRGRLVHVNLFKLYLNILFEITAFACFLQ